jgi:hypothetical protein
VCAKGKGREGTVALVNVKTDYPPTDDPLLKLHKLSRGPADRRAPFYLSQTSPPTYPTIKDRSALLGKHHLAAWANDLIVLEAFANRPHFPIKVVATGPALEFLDDNPIETLGDDCKTP